MKKKLFDMFSKVEAFTRKNSPAILTGVAVVGIIATAVSAYKAGLKADEILKHHREDMKYVEKGDKEARRAVVKETVKDMAPILLPPIIMGVTTTACVIGAQSVSSRRIAALSAVYSISETTVKNLTEKIEELDGPKKVQKIKDSIAKDKLDKYPVQNENQVVITGDGTVLCKDGYTGRYFRSNADRINQAINELSSNILYEMYVSLNDFYDLLGLPQVPIGNDLGWNVDDAGKGKLPISISALLTEDNQPCLCVEYDISIRADFRDLH